MASLRQLYQPPSTSTSLSVPRPSAGTLSNPRISARGGQPYDAASTGRRAQGWQPSRLGPTTNLYISLDTMRARSRDEIRNNGWAASAIDTFEAQMVGNGIRPHWNLADTTLKQKIEQKFAVWANSRLCSHDNQLNFWGIQALAAREIFESGEIFVRKYVRIDKSPTALKVPLKLQLIEGEQCPIWQNSAPNSSFLGTPPDHSIKAGIEFDADEQKVAYIMYKHHPGETMFFPDAMQYKRVPVDSVLHAFRPLRAGQLRGQPHLTTVISLLHSLDKYTDAALFKKEIQAMFAGFVRQVTDNSGIIPPIDTSSITGDAQSQLAPDEPGIVEARLEGGTLQYLNAGEDITFPSMPQDNDIETFLSVHLHKLAVGLGLTYEQLTGDLRGVNLSSIRAGILDFRRKCEQFQYNILVAQLVDPLVSAWLLEAVISGELSLPGYANNPELYQDITFSTSGWPWIDPLADAEAKQLMVRCGFTSRESVVSETGEDSAVIDAQNARDNKRADTLDLIYDSDGRQSPKGPAPPPADGSGNSAPAGGSKSKKRKADQKAKEAATIPNGVDHSLTSSLAWNPHKM